MKEKKAAGQYGGYGGYGGYGDYPYGDYGYGLWDSDSFEDWDYYGPYDYGYGYGYGRHGGHKGTVLKNIN